MNARHSSKSCGFLFLPDESATGLEAAQNSTCSGARWLCGSPSEWESCSITSSIETALACDDSAARSVRLAAFGAPQHIAPGGTNRRRVSEVSVISRYEWYEHRGIFSMPIYEYQCEDCGTRHEKLVMARGQVIACPKCESRRQTIQISIFSASAKSGSGSAATSSPSGSGCGCAPRTCGCH